MFSCIFLKKSTEPTGATDQSEEKDQNISPTSPLHPPFLRSKIHTDYHQKPSITQTASILLLKSNSTSWILYEKYRTAPRRLALQCHIGMSDVMFYCLNVKGFMDFLSVCWISPLTRRPTLSEQGSARRQLPFGRVPSVKKKRRKNTRPGRSPLPKTVGGAAL